MDVSLFKEAFESSKMDFILSHALYCRDVLKLKKGQRVVISNGRVRTFWAAKLASSRFLSCLSPLRCLWSALELPSCWPTGF